MFPCSLEHLDIDMKGHQAMALSLFLKWDESRYTTALQEKRGDPCIPACPNGAVGPHPLLSVRLGTDSAVPEHPLFPQLPSMGTKGILLVTACMRGMKPLV